MNNRELLGVGQSADKSEIKQAFRKAAKEFHPDISQSPEAAEAFARIKEAHDALMKEAEAPRESVSAQSSSAQAVASTVAAAFTTRPVQPMSDEETAKQQELDELARAAKKQSLFHRKKESEELKRHRRKLKTNERRLRGLY